MGEILVTGFPYGIQIEGDVPTKDELKRIDQLILKLPQLENIQKSQPRSIFGIDLPQSSKDWLQTKIDFHKEEEAKNILKQGGFETGKKTPPLEKLFGRGILAGAERDKGFIAGGLFGSAPGLKDMIKLKNIKNIPVSPRAFVFAGGKALFGGIFGSIGGVQAMDLANYVLSGGDKDFLSSFEQFDQDTKDAIFWESLSLGLPEVIPALFRAGSKLKDPAVQKVIAAAERLGINLDLRFITKYGGMGKSIGPLPLLGGVVRSGGKVIGKQLNTYYNSLLSKLAPVTKFTDMGQQIYASSTGMKKIAKQTMSDLWTEAYKLHALLPDKNIFKASDLTRAIDGVISGNTFKLSGSGAQMPRGKNGIILPYEELVKMKWFEDQGLSRLKSAAAEDFFTTLRGMQKDIFDQGGELSYSQISKFRGKLDGLFTDFSGMSNQAQDFMQVILAQLRGGADEAISIANMNKEKLKLVDPNAVKTLYDAHETAMNFTKATLKLWEGDAASIFGKYVKNMYKSGYEIEKKAADTIFEGFMKLKSPEQLKQVKELIGKDNYKKLINEYLDNALKNSLTGTGNPKAGDLIFDPVELGKQIGYDKRQASEFWEQIFKDSDIPKIVIDDLMQVGGALKNLPIGDPSTFLQRRLQLTGIDKILNTVSKFLPTVRTAAAGAASYGLLGPVGSLITILGTRYGFGKLFSNPQLAKKVINVQDIAQRQIGEWGTGPDPLGFLSFNWLKGKAPLPQIGFKSKFGLMRDLFNFHLNETPDEFKEEESSSVFTIFNDLYKDGVEFNSTLEEGEKGIPKETLKYLQDLRDEYINPIDLLKNNDEEEIIEEQGSEDETSFLEVPQINNNFNTEQVVSPIPLPEIASASMSDPNTLTRLEEVGMPLFNANQGGIASLCGDKKPQQMVA
tara:strand:- start:95 stop:2806 length:2712 start_codon:yes stop_codon:yes gene_type:complete